MLAEVLISLALVALNSNAVVLQTEQGKDAVNKFVDRVRVSVAAGNDNSWRDLKPLTVRVFLTELLKQLEISEPSTLPIQKFQEALRKHIEETIAEERTGLYNRELGEGLIPM